MLRFENVATPFTAATLRVPDSVPAPGFVPMSTVIVPRKVVSVVPTLSWAATFTGGAIELPAVVVLGWTVNTTRVAGAPDGVGAGDAALRLRTVASHVVGWLKPHPHWGSNEPAPAATT